MNEAIKTTVQSLQQIFTIVLALSIAEAFKQFIADPEKDPEKRRIHWDRVWSLIAFLALIVPFLHGMTRYLFEVYLTTRRPANYAPYLMIDVLWFTFEASLFFLLSRSLDPVQWRRFFWTVVTLLVVDIAWATFVYVWSKQGSPTAPWAAVNAVVSAILIVQLIVFRKATSPWFARFATILVVVRSVVDYWQSWDFYFPA